MKGRIVFILFLLTLTGFVKAESLWQKFEKSAFYQVMASGKLDDVNDELNAIAGAPAGDRDAYEGVLLMRKAGLVSKPKDKLQYFKSGRIKFQTAFMADSSNAEFRFLRLGIQEHAPKIVKYRSDINADKAYIKEHFKSLPPVVQHAIREYSKTSKVLHPEDF
ncbi:hypothetical protein [Mucilaginibacter polytrichastri]|uniref:Uncharacterized protein n=1 Tax=Mucilaginibacter polytrichastri TaxID=1302689 RepID=A0A1Q6A4H9_9SPHI|nr:hypothetical protein [Mucilaginibacter polytrichastri]OKS88915.1 hypothetical protein RG47T_4393 [Mucilaginibacter polytrichastri]SFT25661.1 hypothetical protein SAMN04487890_12343 [Mucilaginibacter polytrichastri]